ncbi:MAG: 30S ribosomal protein S2 [Chloroflexota bacterium]
MTTGTQRIIPLKSLLEAGAHFGHQTNRWNPKMRSYIFTARNGIHIIDLQKTIVGLTEAYHYITETVAAGGKILFVGTKKQAQDVIQEEAIRSSQLYITQRWLGGTLTNFFTMRQRLRYLLNLEDQRDRGEFAKLTKAEGLKLEQEIEKLNRVFSGIKKMDQLPSALFVVDPHKEVLAIREGVKVGIPIIAMVDTNCDPDPVDYVIPCNDDAIRSIRLLVSRMADAAIEGQNRRESSQADQMSDGRYDPMPEDIEEIEGTSDIEETSETESVESEKEVETESAEVDT